LASHGLITPRPVEPESGRLPLLIAELRGFHADGNNDGEGDENGQD
jgi:hypothetical protein